MPKGVYKRIKPPWNVGITHSEETKKKLSLIRKGKIGYWSGKKLSKEHIEKVRVKQIGRKFSDETKQKQREARLRYLEKVNGFVCQRIGRDEKEILDRLEIELGYRIIRQFIVGGYYLDGYIPEINIAIEVDEKYHQNSKRIEKDLIREEFIRTKLGCNFVRIKEL